MLKSLFNSVVGLSTTGLQDCNFIKHRCFPVNIAKFLRTSILKNICERFLLIVCSLKLDGTVKMLQKWYLFLFLFFSFFFIGNLFIYENAAYKSSFLICYTILLERYRSIKSFFQIPSKLDLLFVFLWKSVH